MHNLAFVWDSLVLYQHFNQVCFFRRRCLQLKRALEYLLRTWRKWCMDGWHKNWILTLFSWAVNFILFINDMLEVIFWIIIEKVCSRAEFSGMPKLIGYVLKCFINGFFKLLRNLSVIPMPFWVCCMTGILNFMSTSLSRLSSVSPECYLDESGLSVFVIVERNEQIAEFLCYFLLLCNSGPIMFAYFKPSRELDSFLFRCLWDTPPVWCSFEGPGIACDETFSLWRQVESLTTTQLRLFLPESWRKMTPCYLSSDCQNYIWGLVFICSMGLGCRLTFLVLITRDGMLPEGLG